MKFSYPATSGAMVLTLVCVLISCGGALHAQPIVEQFKLLSERCRIAIEQSEEFDAEGMLEAPFPKDGYRAAHYTRKSAWKFTGSPFYVAFSSWTSRDNGQERSNCNIGLLDDQRNLSSSDQGELLRAFLIRRNQLLARQTHETRDGTNVPALLMLGHGPVERNPDGCRVVTSIALTSDGGFFSVGSGEQAIYDCEGGDP